MVVPDGGKHAEIVIVIWDRLFGFTTQGVYGSSTCIYARVF